ncbi:MAG: HTTM domain-containing protein [Bacteroidota bacterium]
MVIDLKYWHQHLVRRHVPIYPLVWFRIIFGTIMLFSTARFMALGWIEEHYIEPVFHFHYYGFHWIAPLDLMGMYLVHILLLVAALFVVLGWYYRWSALLVFLCFTYTELIDLTYYLNHYYFVSLLSFLMLLLPAHRACSLDVRWRKLSYCNRVPIWTINSLKLMIAIVYVYAGLAKINTTWLLDAMPLKLWLSAHDKMPLIGDFLAYPPTAYLFSWAGMLYDTCIIFFLLYRPTRKWAFASVVAFHTLTALLFQIGVFPLVMIVVVTIFFSDEWHKEKLLQLAHFFDRKQVHYLNTKAIKPYQNSTLQGRLIPLFLAAFFLFQLFFPWRYLLYDSNIFWSEEGYRYSWRVMLMEKSGTATFYVKDGVTGKEGRVVNSDFLNRHQEKQMAMQPDMIIQYVQFLGRYYRKKGIQNPSIRAEVFVTLNGYPSQLFIDPQLDLLTIKDDWSKRDWIKDLLQVASRG